MLTKVRNILRIVVSCCVKSNLSFYLPFVILANRKRYFVFVLASKPFTNSKLKATIDSCIDIILLLENKMPWILTTIDIRC